MINLKNKISNALGRIFEYFANRKKIRKLNKLSKKIINTLKDVNVSLKIKTKNKDTNIKEDISKIINLLTDIIKIDDSSKKKVIISLLDECLINFKELNKVYLTMLEVPQIPSVVKNLVDVTYVLNVQINLEKELLYIAEKELTKEDYEQCLGIKN